MGSNYTDIMNLDIIKEFNKNFLTFSEAGLPKIYDRMDRIMRKFNTEDIISSIIEYQFMDLIDSLRLNKAELIAGRLIKFNIIDSKYSYLFNDSERLLDLADNAILSIAFGNMVGEGMKVKDSDEEEKKKVEKSLSMKSKYIFHRGDGYVKQLIEFAEQLYSKFNKEIEDAFGFTYSQCQSFIIYLYQTYHRVTDEMNERFFGKLDTAIFNDIYQNNYPTILSISNGYIYRVKKSNLHKIFGQKTSDNIINYLGLKLGESNGEFNNLDDFNILYSKPIVDFGEYIYLMLPINAIQNLPKLFHYEFIAGKKICKEARDQYTKWRGDLLEKLTSDYMKRIFNKEEVYKSLYYYQNGKRFEADVTVQNRDITLLCECKSKLLVLNSLKGKLESIEKDFQDAIGKAYEQIVRTERWINNGNEFQLEETRDNSIKKIKLNETKDIFKICIVADHFGWIPSNIKDYIKTERIEDLPLVLNIYDLDIITREVKNSKELINYLRFRRDYQDKIVSIDELEIFCAIRRDNSIHEKSKKADMVFVDSYTDEIDRKYYEESHKWIIKYRCY